ncbi:ComEC/Rec2 family competence protein [Sphingobacterium griseoflavum]|uniref:Competence protein n=1 Tax=Sphingobacterium griseoflavum TaxID=1474952 RepID=A0ABQ3HSZ2_9SPHI|nr:ComEC/Rec2 family competence protein [Sphingobacterium griseoflavum]GHE23566.1 competence protein [Sphingobacterium griseoflavum]
MVAISIAEALRRTPFAKLFSVLSLGIVAGRYIEVSTTLLHLSSIIFLIIVSLLFLCAAFSKTLPRAVFPVLLYFCFVWVGFQSIAYRLPIHQKLAIDGYEADAVIGIVSNEPTVREKIIRFPISITQGQLGKDRFPASGSIIVSVVRTANMPLNYGDKIAIVNKLQKIPPAYNPHQFDYQQYLANKNVYHQAFLQEGEWHVLEKGSGNWLVSMALHLRHRLRDKFGEVISDPASLNVCAALVFGYRNDFNDEILQKFSVTGTVHVLSVSGMHVGLVFYLLNLLFSRLKFYKYGRFVRNTCMLIAIWSYVILTGMAPSILRAGLMISFLLLADLGKKRYGGINSLFVSAFVLVAFDPFLLFDVGFQLSYAAAFGLFTAYPLLRSLFRPKFFLARYLMELVWVSIAAQLFTSPLALYYFHQFPNYFLLGNLLVAIPSTLLMYIGILLAVSPLTWLNIILGKCLDGLCTFMLMGLDIIQSLPFALVSDIYLEKIDLFFFIGILLTMVWSWYSRRKSILAMVLLFTAMLSFRMGVQRLRRQMFQGLKIYNVQHDLAVAIIHTGRAALVTTLDSMDHPKLKRLVMGDLSRYADPSQIAFYKADVPVKGIRLIETPFGRIALTNRLDDTAALQSASWIIARQLRNQNAITTCTINPKRAIIFDGSNEAGTIAFMVQGASSGHAHYYILKNNYAYVWEKSD